MESLRRCRKHRSWWVGTSFLRSKILWLDRRRLVVRDAVGLGWLRLDCGWLGGLGGEIAGPGRSARCPG